MRTRRTATYPGPAGAEVPAEDTLSQAWSALYHDFGVAERERVERQRAAEHEQRVRREQAARAHEALQQLMAYLFTCAQQRAAELEQKTGVAVQVRRCERPSLDSAPPDFQTQALKLTAGASVVYLYPANAADASVLHLHLLPCLKDSIQRGQRLVSQFGATLLVRRSGYELRLLDDESSASSSANADRLLLRVFRLLLQGCAEASSSCATGPAPVAPG